MPLIMITFLWCNYSYSSIYATAVSQKKVAEDEIALLEHKFPIRITEGV